MDLAIAVETVARGVIGRGQKTTMFLGTHQGSYLAYSDTCPDPCLATMEVHPDELYQWVPSPKGKEVFQVCANGIRSSERAWPCILSASLLHAILSSVDSISRNLLREQEQVEYEIGGDVLCQRGSSLEWSILALPCHSENATRLSSEPSCARQKACQNPDSRRDTWDCVGEFHTHPPPEAQDPNIIKPPSDSDIFQLLLAASKDAHGCALVLSQEGVYHASPTIKAIRLFEAEIGAFYKKSDLTALRKTHAFESCRQPIPAVVSDNLPYLHAILHKLRKGFYELMASRVFSERDARISEYAASLQTLHVTLTYLPWKWST
jgi:hypothetical protein